MSLVIKYMKDLINSNEYTKNFSKKIGGKFNFNLTLKIYDKKYKIPVIKSIGLGNFAQHEIWFYDLLMKLLPLKKGCFIDVGANVGQTLLKLRSISQDIFYYGIEPNPTCTFYCKELIKKNKFKNTYIIPIGIFSDNKILNLNLISESDSSGSIIDDLRPGSLIKEKFFVPVLKFDTIIDSLKIDDIGIVKIDVEGSELEVLKSMNDTIQNFKPIILCEILWAHNKDKLEYCKDRNNYILSLMDNLGYKIFRIIKSARRNTIESIKLIRSFENCIYTKENNELCDYILLPNELEKIITEAIQ